MFYELRKVRELLIELVATYAMQDDKTFDSNGISVLADAMRYLASINVLEIERSVEDRVIARWKHNV